MTLHLTALMHACRCIDKAGGLDQYLLKTSHEELASDTGSNLKEKIMMEKDASRISNPAIATAALSNGQISL